jgi:hypothetical protein
MPSCRSTLLILIAAALPAFSAESFNDPGPPPSWKEPIDFLKKTFSSVFGVAGKIGKKATGLVSGVFDIGPKNPDGTPRKKVKVNVQVQVEPAQVVLEKDRKLNIKLVASNLGKRAEIMDFPSSQRVDAVLRDEDGAIVGRASEDLEFSDEPGVLTLNPSERIEYTMSISTRGLAAGKTYKLEAALTNQNGLSASSAILVK